MYNKQSYSRKDNKFESQIWPNYGKTNAWLYTNFM